MKKKQGDRVVTSEGEGEVIEVCDAQVMYPAPPGYKPGHRRERLKTKFPIGTEIYRVQLDNERMHKGSPRTGAPLIRAFHESQITG